MLMPDTDRAGAVTAGQNVLKAISAITIAGIEAPITDSMGIAVLPEDAPDATTLIEHADRALYTAKRIGRNRVKTAFGGLGDEHPNGLDRPAASAPVGA